MSITTSLRRIGTLSGRDWLLLGEATVMLALASLAVRWLPFRNAIRFGSVLQRQIARLDSDRRVVWSVQRVADSVPWRNVCLQQALAAQCMLRRRGHDARLHYGVGETAAGSLAAHAWVVNDGCIIIGGEVEQDFAVVAVYPPCSAD